MNGALRQRWRRLVLLSALPLALIACGKSTGAPDGAGGAMPPPEVAVVTVQAKAQPVEQEYVGQTAGSRETEVRARVAGILQKRLYEEGTTVKAGTPLFQIDPATFQTQLASAEAAVAVAEARLNQARRDAARLGPLAAENAISQKEFDDSKSALETAQASLKQATAQAQEARLNLGYTRVVAPIGGTTGSAAKSDGSLVSAGDSLLTTLVQTNPMYVNFSISENDLLRMTRQVSSGQLTVPGKRAANGSLGFTVTVRLADGSLYPRSGKLNFASERVNPQTGSFDARAEIPNPDGSLRPGQFVRVVLGGASRPNTLSVPQRAVIDSPMGKMVFVVTPDNKLAPHPVELDGWTQGEWIVSKGLKDGDRVLVDGFIKAHEPGMTVKPVPYVANAQEKTAAAPVNKASSATK
ncbi:efflux RND transporter periplasmic adaptor subunit [Rhodoferax ferrireducens]|uniref:efflux RND transporter periplasmic adaptor subunit n=1 Tax=Rhodoferax ferrireducens TaxID=192843 RepID=UPI000E0CEDEB|nr:efflux RND transporter periplasmic adaptor subunit [Rhodoferax ferrireducens]